LGKAWFYNLGFEVNPSVLIPRPETEELVHMIINRHKGSSPSILDLGTGSGCIAISLALNLPDSRVCGIDISEAALDTARKNALENHACINLQLADMLHFPESCGVYDIIVSNPPYVRESEKLLMEKNVLDHEPGLALFVPDADPLRYYRAIERICQRHLKRGGQLYLEINEGLGNQTATLFGAGSFRQTELWKDLQDKDRFIWAQKHE